MKKKTRKCAHCKEVFEKVHGLQKFCFKEECKKVWIETEREKQWRKQKKEWYEKNKTVQELLKDAQEVFNEWIRLRDAKDGCISCGKPFNEKYDAGHYVASGKSKFLTFHIDNVHGQCVSCNQYKSANLIEYRIRLIKKIGTKRVEWLEENRHKVKHYSREELKQLIKEYKAKVKQLKNK